MLKKILLILSILFAPVLPVASHAAEMVNVEYIHQLIARDWDITIPYNPALINPKVAANMKYLLTAIDVANQKLNGKKTTDYGNGEYATMYAADTIATNTAVRTLIKKESKYPFTATTTSDADSFEIYLTAIGTFTIDWGDGEVQEITRTNTEFEAYSHTYATAGEYTIGIGGRATGYLATENGLPAITFYSSADKLAAVDGSLGAIFPTIGDGSGAGQQPSFMMAFYLCSRLRDIPANLFSGVHGPAVGSMFYSTFGGCAGLTELPEKLFPELSPAFGMFVGTFEGCSSLTSIPANLFAGIHGAPAEGMFSNTFAGCNGLTEIPGDLFAGIRGAPAEYMFGYTFAYCNGLSSCIPDNLFSTIDATLEYIIDTENTFYSSNIIEQYCSEYVPNTSSDMDSKFFITTTNTTTEFEVDLSAKGTFVIDWGDGTKKIIQKGTTDRKTYPHIYDIAGEYSVGIGGIATEYGTNAAISFSYNDDVAAIDGSLGAIFPTIGDGAGDGQQPCFYGTFDSCRSLSGSIPANLFAGIHGAPVPSMFSYTFAYCSGLTEIPAGLFAGISGAPAQGMFHQTFNSCSGLTGIPENLFGNISGPAKSYMFGSTFYGCTGLSGESAKIGGQHLYEIWPDATTAHVGGCYNGATGLSDYSQIPSNWK